MLPGVLCSGELSGQSSAGADPLYVHLKSAAPGVLGSEGIKWNFTKFLVDRTGKVIARYASATKPADLEPDLEKALGSSPPKAGSR